MGPQTQTLTRKIRELLAEATKALVDLTDRSWDLNSVNTLDRLSPESQAYTEASERLYVLIEAAFADTALLAEHLGHPLYAKRVSDDRKSFADLSDVVPPDDYDSYFTSEPLNKVRSLFRSLAILTDPDGANPLTVLENNLRNTHRAIQLAKITPTKEADVVKVAREALQLSFSGVVREPNISQSWKSFRPDLAIPDLMVAIEYKFIETAPEATNAIDQLLIDMKAYEYGTQYHFFYAVLYCATPVITQEEVDRAFSQGRASKGWRIIVVHGDGARATKVRKSSATSAPAGPS